jgi:hypothetical protein
VAAPICSKMPLNNIPKGQVQVASGDDQEHLFSAGLARHALLGLFGGEIPEGRVLAVLIVQLYAARPNRPATIQEHYMIVRALERGVSEEKLARQIHSEPTVARTVLL